MEQNNERKKQQENERIKTKTTMNNNSLVLRLLFNNNPSESVAQSLKKPITLRTHTTAGQVIWVPFWKGMPGHLLVLVNSIVQSDQWLGQLGALRAGWMFGEAHHSHTQIHVYWLKLDEVAEWELSKGVDTSSHISAQLEVFGQNFQLVTHKHHVTLST